MDLTVDVLRGEPDVHGERPALRRDPRAPAAQPLAGARPGAGLKDSNDSVARVWNLSTLVGAEADDPFRLGRELVPRDPGRIFDLAEFGQERDEEAVRVRRRHLLSMK